tara:strand:+ start:1043 stop:1549 length:507 start_codon:yes stop_codon:yes gene_type:complete
MQDKNYGVENHENIIDIEKLTNLTNDLTNLESNVSKLDIILISVNNYNIEKIDISNISIKDNILNKSDFINILKNVAKNNNNYRLKYILKFLLKLDIDILNDENFLENTIDYENINNDSFELSIIKKIESLDFNNSFFNDTNSLLLVLDKKQKLNIKKKKKNSTKKIR